MENQQEREFSADELAAQKEQMLQFYTESVPYLEAQAKYEDLLLKIEEARFKRTSIQMQYAMMAQAQQEAEHDDKEEQGPLASEEPARRKLRKS